MAAMSAVEKSAFLSTPVLSSGDQSRSASNPIIISAFPSNSTSKARVVAVAVLDRKELLTKPLALLKAIARQKGVTGGTRDQLINALTGPATVSYSRPSPSVSAPSADEASLQQKTLGELRAMAKERGLRGDTKAEIVKLLLATGGATSATSQYAYTPAPTFTAPPSTSSTAEYERRLAVKSLSKLRAVARQRGIAATTRSGLISELLKHHASAGTPGASAAAVAAAKEDAPEIQEQLESLPLSELRAMAKDRGLRGDTRKELIKILTSGPKAIAAKPVAAVSYSNGAAASTSFFPSSSSSTSSYKAAAGPSEKELATKPLSLLRAMAAQKGIRGVSTRMELIKALSK